MITCTVLSTATPHGFFPPDLRVVRNPTTICAQTTWFGYTHYHLCTDLSVNYVGVCTAVVLLWPAIERLFYSLTVSTMQPYSQKQLPSQSVTF